MSKILFLANDLSSGGAERQMITVAILLKEKGFEVEILCYERGDFYYEILKNNNIPVFWKIEDNYFIRLIKIRKFIRNSSYNVVISFLETANFLNCFSSIGGKKWKIITGERSSKKSTFISKRGIIFSWFQRYSDYIVCNSNNSKKMWLKYYPNYACKLVTIYNNVQLPNITSEYIVKKNNMVHIVIAASFRYLKNPIGVVKALSLLNDDERKKIHVEWYGQKEFANVHTQPYDDAIKLINKHNLKDTICLNPPTKDIANIMNSSDFVGLFSELEGLPNAICEGMMIGKPIIMTRVSDYSKLIDNTNGLLCNWEDIESIKDAFLSAINLKEKDILQMGVISKEKAESLFSKNEISKAWLRIIEN